MKVAGKLPSSSRGASSSSLPAHRLSHAIAKAPQPKIRIIHVVEAEVIKTEARHFRELVQRLTGKPPPKKDSCASSSASTGGDASPSPSPPTSASSSCDTAGDEGVGACAAGAAVGIGIKVKEEPAETPFPSGGEGGGFLRALEMDGYPYHDGGFYQGIEDFFTPCDMDGAVAGFHF